MAIDLNNGYAELLSHVGHAVVVAAYGARDAHGVMVSVANVAIECEDCGVVLIDFDKSI